MMDYTQYGLPDRTASMQLRGRVEEAMDQSLSGFPFNDATRGQYAPTDYFALGLVKEYEQETLRSNHNYGPEETEDQKYLGSVGRKGRSHILTGNGGTTFPYIW